jgi:hypothetical protein
VRCDVVVIVSGEFVLVRAVVFVVCTVFQQFFLIVAKLVQFVGIRIVILRVRVVVFDDFLVVRAFVVRGFFLIRTVFLVGGFLVFRDFVGVLVVVVIRIGDTVVAIVELFRWFGGTVAGSVRLPSVQLRLCLLQEQHAGVAAAAASECRSDSVRQR